MTMIASTMELNGTDSMCSSLNTHFAHFLPSQRSISWSALQSYFIFRFVSPWHHHHHHHQCQHHRCGSSREPGINYKHIRTQRKIKRHNDTLTSNDYKIWRPPRFQLRYTFCLDSFPIKFLCTINFKCVLLRLRLLLVPVRTEQIDDCVWLSL